MAIAGTLEVQMVANMARFADDMNKAKNIAGGAMKNIESAVASAKSALGALGIGLGVGYFATLIKGTIDAADHFNDLTQSMGANRQELAKYQLATAQSGSSLGGLSKGVKGLTVAFAEHGDALRAAGITATTADGQIKKIAEMFANMPDGLEKTTLAVKLFGRSGMELIPMLNMGAAGLDVAAEKSAKYAAVMAELAPRADKFNDTMVELGMAGKVVGLSLVNDALPAMSQIAAAMAQAAHESGALTAAWVGLGGVGAKTFDFLTVLLNGFLANLQGLNSKMLQFFGDTKGAAQAAASEAAMYAKIRELTDQGSSAPEAPKQFDQAAWMANYKKMLEALGIGKVGAAKSTDAELKKLLDLGTKGEIDSLIARQKAWEDEQKAINDLKNAGFDETKKENELLTQQAQNWRDVLDPMLPYQRQMEEINNLYAKNKLSTEEWAAAINSVSKNMGEVGKVSEKVDSMWGTAAKDMQRAMATFFFDGLQGKMTSFGASFKNMVDKMLSDWMAAQAQMALFGDFAKTNKMGGLFGQIMGALGGSSYYSGGAGGSSWTSGYDLSFGGAQAAGGDYMVTKPTLFLAGEAGPERARFSGANKSGGDGDINITQHMTFGSDVDRGTLMQWAQTVKQQTVAAVVDLRARNPRALGA